jgi:hypothetical protein
MGRGKIRSRANSPPSAGPKPEAGSNFFLTGVNVEERDFGTQPLPELDRQLDVSDKIDSF